MHEEGPGGDYGENVAREWEAGANGLFLRVLERDEVLGDARVLSQRSVREKRTTIMLARSSPWLTVSSWASISMRVTLV